MGKTAVAEGLAQRIVDRDVPPNLLGRLWSLDMGALMAGASYKGQYEERIKSVLDECEKSETGVILFIDEVHLLMAGQGSSGGGMDAANLLKPAMARGKIRVIAATTLNEYRQYIEKDAAFERRFQQVIVNEPTVPESISILRGIKEKYEVHHGVTILDSALVAAATLAHRYLTSRRLPDSAIDCIDEACSAVRIARESAPEDVDRLERAKLQLEIEMHALQGELARDKKDEVAKAKIEEVKQAIAKIEDELAPIKARFEAEKAKTEELNRVRKRIDELTAKAADAERKYECVEISLFLLAHSSPVYVMLTRPPLPPASRPPPTCATTPSPSSTTASPSSRRRRRPRSGSSVPRVVRRLLATRSRPRRSRPSSRSGRASPSPT